MRKNLFIITGTSRGIGNSLVQQINKQGDSDIFCLSREDNVTTLDQIGETRINFIETDLSKIDLIKPIVNNIFSTLELENYERIVLINNAGVLEPVKFIEDVDLELANINIDVNFKAIVHTMSAFLKSTESFKREKVVMNISSGAAQKPSASMSIYNATKAAVEMLTLSVAMEQEHREFPAKIVAFHPGKVETRMQELIRNVPEKDFPNLNVFLEAKKNGEIFTSEIVAEILVDLLLNSDIVNGTIYKARELISNL